MELQSAESLFTCNTAIILDLLMKLAMIRTEI